MSRTTPGGSLGPLQAEVALRIVELVGGEDGHRVFTKHPLALTGPRLGCSPAEQIAPLWSGSPDSQPVAMFVNSCYPPRGLLGKEQEVVKEKGKRRGL